MSNGGYSAYEAPELATQEKRYKWQLWWVENRARLGQIGLGLWGATATVLILFSLWTMIDTFLISYEDERALANGFAANQQARHAYNLATAPEAIALTTSSVFTSGQGRYDFFAQITNPNQDYWLEFDYYFLSAGEPTATRRGFVFPGQTKPLIELAHEATVPPGRVEAVVENLDWHFVDPHQIPDWPAWYEDRINFVVSDTGYIPSIDIGPVVGRSSFTVRNNTAYGYWEPLFYVLLYRGASVVGVTTVTLDEFASGDQRTVQQNWFGAIASVTDVEVIPEINLFDSSEFMPLDGSRQRDLN